jgi:hypothetical protein
MVAFKAWFLERDSNPLHIDSWSIALPIELSKRRNSRESNPTALPLSPRELHIKQSTCGGIRNTQLEPFEASRTVGEQTPRTCKRIMFSV